MPADDPLGQDSSVLVVSIPSNRVAFLGDDALGPDTKPKELAEEGAWVFLAAYGIQADPRRTV
jgi:hypothetical protein